MIRRCRSTPRSIAPRGKSLCARHSRVKHKSRFSRLARSRVSRQFLRYGSIFSRAQLLCLIPSPNLRVLRTRKEVVESNIHYKLMLYFYYFNCLNCFHNFKYCIVSLFSVMNQEKTTDSISDNFSYF